MLHTLKLELLTEMLGNLQSAQGIKKFKRVKSGAIAFDFATWSWASSNAANQLGITFDEANLRPSPSWCHTPRVIIHKRNWEKNGVPMVDTFESFQPHNEISIKMFIAKPAQGSRGNAPTPAEVVQMAEIVGEYFGLSPWGSKFGCGRFKVLSFKQD